MSMGLKIVMIGLADPSTRTKDGLERVELVVTAECNLSEYIVMHNAYNPDNTASNAVTHSYQFPDVAVRTDDRVTLWTTDKGPTETDSLPDGGTKYHFGWGLDETIWNNSADKAKLIHIGDVQTFSVPSPKL